MDAIAESGRNPVNKHHIHPECGKWATRVYRLYYARENHYYDSMDYLSCVAC